MTREAAAAAATNGHESRHHPPSSSPATSKSLSPLKIPVKTRAARAGNALGLLVDGLLKSLSTKIGERSLISQQVGLHFIIFYHLIYC